MVVFVVALMGNVGLWPIVIAIGGVALLNAVVFAALWWSGKKTKEDDKI